jgi:succinoglycan biosynthesis protein ExoM
LERIDVCICTFRRSSLIDTIRSVATQDARGDIAIRIVVADNDVVPSAQSCLAEAERSGVAIAYVHAPAQNISIARNACLDAAETRWIAFIDDDEIAAPDWLATLVAARDGCEVVFGRSRAMLDDPAVPRWMREGRFHDNEIGPRDGAFNGYTCNVLIDREFLRGHGIRFLEPLGRTGGEDTMLFDDVRRAGGHARYVATAVVDEEIPPHRATLSWLVRRRFRAGQIHCLLARRDGTPPLRRVPTALAKLTWCFALALVTLPARRRSVSALLRGMLHLGFLASALGVRTYAEYGAAQPATSGRGTGVPA